uniref:Uncharacterized protein n=1 Tax=Arundo donax TaxID=35708 RepID=A0A0A9GLP4_ARUDO
MLHCLQPLLQSNNRKSKAHDQTEFSYDVRHHMEVKQMTS